MTTFAQALYADLAAHRQPEQADAMAAYMKNHFVFFGIKAPKRRELFKAALKRHAQMSYETARAAALDLWAQPQRECHYCAIELLQGHKKAFLKEDMSFLERFIVENAWWDTVDTVATHIISAYFKRYPETIRPQTEVWIDSGHLWLQRTCLIFQLTYKQQTDRTLLADYSLLFAEDNRFFIQKAIGWALRQYARTDPRWVAAFVANHTLKPLSQREALKHIG